MREYPWGSCEALSSRHSDLAALKKLLFEVGTLTHFTSNCLPAVDHNCRFCRLSILERKRCLLHQSVLRSLLGMPK